MGNVGLLLGMYMTETTKQPTREEFVAFWKEEKSMWRSLFPYGIYISGLVLCATVVRLADVTVLFWFASVVGIIAYAIVVPWIWIRNFHKRYARFIRCSQCGDWLGRDSSGAWYGPDPKWVSVGQTGHCGKCGERLLSEE